MTTPDRRRVDRRKSASSNLTTPDRRRGDRRIFLGLSPSLMPPPPDRRGADRRAPTPAMQLPADTAMLTDLRAELSFSALSPAFAHTIEAAIAANPGIDHRLLLADWLCRGVLPLALQCAGWDRHAGALRAALAITADTDIAWEHRLMQLRESVERVPDYRALVVVPDVDSCPLVACAVALERSLGGALRSPALASGLTHDLASRAIVEHRRLRELAAGLVHAMPDPTIERRCELVEQRHRAFLESESQLLESLGAALAPLHAPV
jgi:hypothetical protein